jgi:hypothetical protein
MQGHGVAGAWAGNVIGGGEFLKDKMISLSWRSSKGVSHCMLATLTRLDRGSMADCFLRRLEHLILGAFLILVHSPIAYRS